MPKIVIFYDPVAEGGHDKEWADDWLTGPHGTDFFKLSLPRYAYKTTDYLQKLVDKLAILGFGPAGIDDLIIVSHGTAGEFDITYPKDGNEVPSTSTGCVGLAQGNSKPDGFCTTVLQSGQFSGDGTTQVYLLCCKLLADSNGFTVCRRIANQAGVTVTATDGEVTLKLDTKGRPIAVTEGAIYIFVPGGRGRLFKRAGVEGAFMLPPP